MRLKYLLFILLSGYLLSFEAFSQSRIHDLEQLKMDVQRSMRPDQFKTLLLGEQETVVVINESQQALSKGVAVLVSETGRNGASQLALAPLSPFLTEFGWTTIMVTAPNLDMESMMPMDMMTASSDGSGSEQMNTGSTTTEQMADSAQSQNSDPNAMPPPNQLIPSYTATPVISDALFQQQEQAFQLLMNAIETERQTYPGFFLLIAQGTSAAWLAKLYNEGNMEMPDALVTLGVNWPQHDLNLQVPGIIAETIFPVLDIYNQFDSEWSLQTTQQRRVAAVKALKLHYRQREIIGTRFDHTQQEYLAREIHGWLTYMGW